MSSSANLADTAAGLSPEDAELIATVAITLNAASLCITIPSVITYSIVRRFVPGAVDRVSLRLAVAICIADVMYAVAQILTSVAKEGGWLCSVAVFGYIAFSLAFMFLSACVAVNLHVLFLASDDAVGRGARAQERARVVDQAAKGASARRTRLSQHLEPYYYAVSIVLALSLALPGLVMGQYGWDEAGNQCWFQNSTSLRAVVWQWSALYAWLALMVLYCAVVVGLVWWKVTKESRELAVSMDAAIIPRGVDVVSTASSANLTEACMPSDSEMITAVNAIEVIESGCFRESGRQQQSRTRRRQASFSLFGSPGIDHDMLTVDEIRQRTRRFYDLRLVLFRILIYLVIPMCTQTGNIILIVYYQVVGSKSFPLLLFSHVSTSMQGILNALTLLFIDPSMRRAYRELQQAAVAWHNRIVVDALEAERFAREVSFWRSDATPPGVPRATVLDRVLLRMVRSLWIKQSGGDAPMPNTLPVEIPLYRLGPNSTTPDLHVAGARYQELEKHRNSLAKDEVDRTFLTSHERALSLPTSRLLELKSGVTPAESIMTQGEQNKRHRVNISMDAVTTIAKQSRIPTDHSIRQSVTSGSNLNDDYANVTALSLEPVQLSSASEAEPRPKGR